MSVSPRSKDSDYSWGVVRHALYSAVSIVAPVTALHSHRRWVGWVWALLVTSSIMG